MAIEIAEETVEQNSSQWVEKVVAEDLDMTQKSIHMYVINGASDGPTLWMQGCIHGDEHGSALAIRDFLLNLNPEDVNGAIIGVPVANVWSFAAMQRRTPLDQLGNHDANRSFPGDPDGAYTEQLTYVLSSIAEEHADLFIDCHTATGKDILSPGYQILRGSGDRQVDEESLELAEVSGFKTTAVFGLEKGVSYASGAGFLWQQANIPGIALESGGAGQNYDWAQDNFKTGFANICKLKDILPGEPVSQTEHTIYHGLKRLKTHTGGFYESFVESDDVVSKGEVVARITDIKGNVKEEITAPEDGRITMQRTYPVCHPGGYSQHMVADNDIGEFPLE